ncbi:unnamed protein product [Paramecium sonneborni]|uniref:Uncharacterized protein n=1 Tax=Paramecium sonneborni TaxID=65129 RepID=A0A8S1RRP9_9CILI|nr:unnamed protein product [Paramecium sonneborni]
MKQNSVVSINMVKNLVHGKSSQQISPILVGEDHTKKTKTEQMDYGLKKAIIFQFINQGEYLKGKKVGRWDILFRNNSTSLFQLMYFEKKILFFIYSGGGSYNEQNMKTGIWIQLNDQFHNNQQCTKANKKIVQRQVDGQSKQYFQIKQFNDNLNNFQYLVEAMDAMMRMD